MRKIVYLQLLVFVTNVCLAQKDIENLNLFLIKSDFSSALKISEKIINENPNNPYNYYLNALINRQLYKFPSANNSILKALEIEPNNTDYLNEYASILLKRNYKVKALDVYQKIHDLDPYHLTAGIYISNDLMKHKKYKDARDILLGLYTNDTLNTYFTRNIGLSYIKEGNKIEAFKWLNKTLELDGTDIKAYVLKARVYSILKEFDLAIENVEKAIELDPFNSDLYIQLGDIHVLRNHNYRAIPVFLKAYKLTNDAFIARSIGFSYFKIKKYEDAKSYLKIADVDSDGSDLQVNIHLGDIYRFQNKMDSSLSYYNSALEILIPDNDSKYSILQSKAECYYYLNDFEKSIEMYQLAYKTDLTSYWSEWGKNKILVDIASIYEEKLNNNDKAIETLELISEEKVSFNKNYYEYAQTKIRELKEELFFETNQ